MNLQRIEAKIKLGLPLNEQERAYWILFGKKK